MKRKLAKGFTLIELMIVVAIIGLLSAVAIPAYQDYIGRAQVSEAISLLSSSKTPFAEYFASLGSWPGGPSEVLGNTTGKYVGAIAIANSSTAQPGSITLVATMRTSTVNINVAGNTVGLNTIDGGKIWSCFTTATGSPLAQKYVPTTCRH
jgi:type IV pilus assembly protein PilA